MSWFAPRDRQRSSLAILPLVRSRHARPLGRVDGLVAEVAAKRLVGVELTLVEPLVAGAVAREDRVLGGVGEQLAGQVGG